MTPAPPPKPQTVGPIGLAFSVSFGLVSVAVGAWIVGMLIEIGGGYFLWKGQGIRHAQSLVQQDLEYIAAAPRSLLVRDTVAFSLQLAGWVRMPYEKLGVLRWYQRMHAPTAAAPTAMPLTGQTVAPSCAGLAWPRRTPRASCPNGSSSACSWLRTCCCAWRSAHSPCRPSCWPASSVWSMAWCAATAGAGPGAASRPSSTTTPNAIPAGPSRGDSASTSLGRSAASTPRTWCWSSRSWWP